MLPTATYRLQFHQGFPFASAMEIAPYLKRLGVSHVYASPILTARAGSNHGYDVVDYANINRELGGRDGFMALADTLRKQGIGIILDIVPNHMAVGGADNALWLDVLQNGRGSRYASWFDIDFDGNDPALKDKVLCPFLGAPYEEVLAGGELRLIHDAALGHFAIAYHHHRFPIRPECLAEIEAAGLAAYESRERLHTLLERQHFRLAWWRVAGDKVNYRRFFDITELAGIEIGVDDAFEAAHAVAFELYAAGLVDGLRVDHIDGLADPTAYCRKLRARLETLERKRPDHAAPGPAYLVVEKILGAGEPVDAGWPVDGTTGYDFMNEVSALQHDPTGEPALTALWTTLSGRSGGFEQEESLARREMLRNNFDGQRETVVDAIKRLADETGVGRDLTWSAIRRGLTNLIEHFRVYRSYATGAPGSPPPGEPFDRALERALRSPGAETRALRFIETVMRGRSGGDAARQALAVRRFNQLAAPIAAKAVEDTAFYRFGRLLSRNDVGFEAGRFSCSPEEFHQLMEHRAANLPRSMLATATHDHKRGEDVRARLAVLSEMPEGWAHVVMQWFAMNEGMRPPGLDPADEYQLYQMLFGAWPLELQPDDAKGLQAFAERLKGWRQKSLREAKLRSSWSAPDETYERIAEEFLVTALDPDRSSAFLRSLHGFVEGAVAAGALNGLVQTLLRCTVPGMPDLYQGAEFWDFSLVDPDNRRPVDYAARVEALAETPVPAALLGQWRNGGIKQAILARLLGLRRDMPGLFAEGDYQPLPVQGRRAGHILAFARNGIDARLVVVAPVHCGQALAEDGTPIVPEDWWGDTAVLLPSRPGRVQDVLGSGQDALPARLPVCAALRHLPVGVWLQTG